MIKNLNPLRLAIDVELARRGLTFADLVRALQQQGDSVAYPSLNQRVDRQPPTKSTIELVARGFGMTFDALLARMKEETAAAIADGRLQADTLVQYVDPGQSVVTAS